MKRVRVFATSALALLVVMTCLAVAFGQQPGGDPPPKITKPVPVVPPPKDDPPPKDEKKEKKVVDDPLPTAEEETSGILPLAFVKNKVDTMPVGTKAYVSLDTIKCDSKRRVWLDPDQVYGTQNEGRVVLVSKTTSGYHITLERIENQWTCQELPSGVKWIPVKSVVSK